jgi:YHS domain-containing protein
MNPEPIMATAKDPVCGMTVDTDTARWTSEHDGRTWYFCAASCKGQFDANPALYTGAVGSSASTERHEPPFTVSGGVAAPKFGAAGSGGAEYELPPEAHDKP